MRRSSNRLAETGPVPLRRGTDPASKETFQAQSRMSPASRRRLRSAGRARFQAIRARRMCRTLVFRGVLRVSIFRSEPLRFKQLGLNAHCQWRAYRRNKLSRYARKSGRRATSWRRGARGLTASAHRTWESEAQSRPRPKKVPLCQSGNSRGARVYRTPRKRRRIGGMMETMTNRSACRRNLTPFVVAMVIVPAYSMSKGWGDLRRRLSLGCNRGQNVQR